MNQEEENQEIITSTKQLINIHFTLYKQLKEEQDNQNRKIMECLHNIQNVRATDCSQSPVPKAEARSPRLTPSSTSKSDDPICSDEFFENYLMKVFDGQYFSKDGYYLRMVKNVREIYLVNSQNEGLKLTGPVNYRDPFPIPFLKQSHLLLNLIKYDNFISTDFTMSVAGTQVYFLEKEQKIYLVEKAGSDTKIKYNIFVADAKLEKNCIFRVGKNNVMADLGAFRRLYSEDVCQFKNFRFI